MNREPTMVDGALDAARRIGAASRDDEIAKLKAENKRLRGHIEQLREAVEEGLRTYKVPMTARICEAIAALAATEPPIGDSGILGGSNRTTGGSAANDKEKANA